MSMLLKDVPRNLPVELNLVLKSNLRRLLIKTNELNFRIKKYNIKETIIIAGSPRSGTTWLSEILRTIPGYTLIFEPLHPVWFPESARINFQRTYIKPDKSWIEAQIYLQKVLTGKTFSTRYRGLDDLSSNLLSDKLIVKFVRANRILPWMASNFQVRRIIFLIRHPCAVISSQIKSGHFGYNDIVTGKDIAPRKEELIREIQEVEGIDNNIIAQVEQIDTLEELLATTWCIDNHVPLFSEQRNSWLLVPYEGLISDGPECLKQIFEIIGINSRINLKTFRTPSKKASSDLLTGDNLQAMKWKNFFSKEQTRRILRIVHGFGLDFYNENANPDFSKLEKLGNLIRGGQLDIALCEAN